MTSTLTQTDLIKTLATGAATTQTQVQTVLQGLGQIIAQNAAEGVTVITPFGRFVPKARAARRGRNPRTGEVVEIAARTTITFKPAKAMA